MKPERKGQNPKGCSIQGLFFASKLPKGYWWLLGRVIRAQERKGKKHEKSGYHRGHG